MVNIEIVIFFADSCPPRAEGGAAHKQQWGVSQLPGHGRAVVAPSYDLRNVKKSKINCFLKHSFNYRYFFMGKVDKRLMHRKVLIDVKLQAQWLKWKKMRSMVVSISKVRATIYYLL